MATKTKLTPAEQLAKAKPPRRDWKKAQPKGPLTCDVRAVRQGLGLSIRDVANAVQMSQSGLHKIELGGDVQMTTVQKLCKFFGKEPQELWLFD